MHIRTGFSIAFDTFGPTPMNLLLNVRPERRGDLLTPEVIAFDPPVAASQHVDAFGNVCTRIVAPGGRITMAADFTIADSGLPDDQAPGARQIAVQDLPDEVVPYLLGSRYCDTDKLSGIAWSLFGGTPEGWARVQAIVDFAHTRLRFDYQQADATRGTVQADLGVAVRSGYPKFDPGGRQAVGASSRTGRRGIGSMTARAGIGVSWLCTSSLCHATSMARRSRGVVAPHTP